MFLKLHADCSWTELDNRKFVVFSHLEGYTNGEKDLGYIVLKMWLSRSDKNIVKLDKIEAIWFSVHGSEGDKHTFICVGDNAGGLFDRVRDEAKVTFLGNTILIDFPSHFPGCYSDTRIMAKRKEKINGSSNKYDCDVTISFIETMSHEDLDGNLQLEIGKERNEHEYKPIDKLILPGYKII